VAHKYPPPRLVRRAEDGRARAAGGTALAGLARARCTLESALGSSLCADPVPARLARALQQKLAAVDALLGRAIGATGAKQAHLAKKAKAELAAVSHKAIAATGAKSAKKRITAPCGAGLDGLVNAVEADLP
jgi:hypothetical protein